MAHFSSTDHAPSIPGQLYARAPAAGHADPWHRSTAELIDFRPDFSRRILLHLLVVGVLALVIGAFSLDYVAELYFRNQLTPVGLVVNGGILVLFLLGLSRIVSLLLRYGREERALTRFVAALEDEERDPAQGLASSSIVAQRYNSLLRLAEQNVPINHSAFAAMLVANEGTRLSLPKFINNILILTGVFGTIVALSIALLGASNLLGPTHETANLGLLVHGMSTALSTTITAIVCYFFYGYFYLRLLDAKTHLITGVEQVTSLYLLPRLAFDGERTLLATTELLESLRETAHRMHAAQADYSEAGTRLRHVAGALGAQLQGLGEDVQAIRHTLREGFRLPPERE